MVSTLRPMMPAKSLLEMPKACAVPWLKMIPPDSGSSSEPATGSGGSWKKFPPIGSALLMRTAWLVPFHFNSNPTEPGRLTSGMIRMTPDDCFQRATSCAVMIFLRDEPGSKPPESNLGGPNPPRPPPVGVTVRRSSPMDANCRLICCRTPAASETMMTMVNVPTTTPSDASAERNLRRPTLDTAVRI